MEPVREIQKIRADLERNHSLFAQSIRAEFIRFSSEIRLLMNSIDARILECIQKEKLK